ncbi:thioredoxin family protein [Bacillus halotolerans]|uniref:Thioredoxin family protein n=1 Tax=Bacillus halotolerans TaxID=260554 RepID=A0ABY7HY81_9BACI|nr:thioredoxin family protein [Bacillus halotolerans]MBL4966362.1 thioredoxin family protein [Bacillus halotolerans]MDG0765029.1 thioredoxin family protein [Bacillus halotolerans]MDL5610774.1 thioredoxin family protein [Bacillus halotolerans]UUI83609.1 thioredoxin family protein [Bacillus halotolerans]UYO31301.1 thioredoxin family protein [Bacillus halotolerans]
MKELQEQELELITDDVYLLYLYTPFCGTCQLASKMLTVVEEMLPSVAFYKNNLNYSPAFAKAYQIESVPCFLLFKGGKVIERGYAFHSVSYLYELIKQKSSSASHL